MNMKSLVIVLLCVYTVYCEPPTLKNCDPNAAAEGVKLTLDGGPDGDEYFTPKTKLTVDFKIDRTFAADAVTEIKLDVRKKLGWLGYWKIPSSAYGFAMKYITLPKGLKHVKDNIFAVTCEALTTKRITACPPKVGPGRAFVDFGPVFAQQKKLMNSWLVKFVSEGSYRIHAEATMVKDGDNAPYSLTCIDVTATTKLSSSK